MTTNGYVLPLHGLSRADAPRVGAKAANLGDLLQAGFPVPAGFAVSVDAFHRFIDLNGFGGTTPPEKAATGRLPDEVAGDLATGLRKLNGAPLAVRSSGVAEDLPGASFAGQYETILGVHGRPEVEQALVRCWASAFSERVATYDGGRVNGSVPPMAVLVQELVQADAAGVAFSANPISGDREEVVVSAVRGLGDRLVSGIAQPDEWFIRRSTATQGRTMEGVIDRTVAERVAEMARRIEGHFGSPQDIEWAIVGDELFVLQARPITALPPRPTDGIEAIPVAVQVPEGYWQREATHFPAPNSPMVVGFLDLHNEAMREMFSAYGLLLETVEMRPVGGWIYARAVPLGGKDRPAPPAPLLWLLARTVPQLRSRIATCRDAIRSDLHGRHVEAWYATWRPDLANEIRECAAVDLAALSAPELAQHLQRLERLVDQAIRLHFLLHGAMIMVLGEFLFACRDLLGWDDRRALDLLSGLSEPSTEPSRALARLAATAAESQAVRPMLERLDATTVDDVLAADPEFGAAFRTYLGEFGCRVLGYEFVEPTLAERPELVLSLVRDQLRRGYDPEADAAALAEERRAALGAVRSALRSRPAALARLEGALARAERAYPVREESEFYTVTAPLGLTRLAALECGHRMSAKGQLEAGDDVFFLTLAEALAAIESGESQVDRVSRRRAERAWVASHPGPVAYGRDPGPPPPAWPLPREARFAMEAVQHILIDTILAPVESGRRQEAGAALSGIAASSGSYRGPARIVRDEADFGKVQPGDVLVSPITSPVWSVLFPTIGALVTDTGGILSHAAIIAREYRLPAVVGTGNATELLSDGQLVTVDGGEGVVWRDA